MKYAMFFVFGLYFLLSVVWKWLSLKIATIVKVLAHLVVNQVRSFLVGLVLQRLVVRIELRIWRVVVALVVFLIQQAVYVHIDIFAFRFAGLVNYLDYSNLNLNLNNVGIC